MTANTTRAAEGARAAGSQGRGGVPVVMDGLTRTFGTVRALHQLSVEIAPGEFVALLGPSGCGKTCPRSTTSRSGCGCAGSPPESAGAGQASCLTWSA